MSNLVALNKTAHKNLKIDTQKVEEQGAELHMVPVILNEFRKLVVHYPIVFSKGSETGQFMCSALMGFEQGENLFWEKGQWQGVYVPLQISRQPFFLGNNQNNHEGQDYVMCINEQSPVIGDSGEALFDEDGNATAFLQSQQNNLMALLQGEQETQAFVNHLIELKLVTAISLDIKFADETTLKVKGLYTVDEDKLEDLSAEQLQHLQQNGYLSAIYAMIHSTGQIYSLIDKKNKRIENATQWFKAAGNQ